MSYKVVVPGHGDISRVPGLHASLETLYNNTHFDKLTQATANYTADPTTENAMTRRLKSS